LTFVNFFLNPVPPGGGKGNGSESGVAGASKETEEGWCFLEQVYRNPVQKSSFQGLKKRGGNGGRSGAAIFTSKTEGVAYLGGVSAGVSF